MGNGRSAGDCPASLGGKDRLDSARPIARRTRHLGPPPAHGPERGRTTAPGDLVALAYGVDGFSASPLAEGLRSLQTTHLVVAVLVLERALSTRRCGPPADPGLGVPAGSAPPDSAAGSARELVGKLLSKLPPEDRLVITLLDLEEKSVKEISELTGWGQSLVKVRAFRARRKLRKLAKAFK